MSGIKSIKCNKKRGRPDRSKMFFLLLLFNGFIFFSYGQFIVSPIQNFNFGTIYQGTLGGTVAVSGAGIRTVTGTVIPMNSATPTTQAIFEIETNVGNIVSITAGPDVNLTNGTGGTMVLHLGVVTPVSPFITNAISPLRTRINVGGTLIVGTPAVSTPGNYTGTFTIILNHQ